MIEIDKKEIWKAKDELTKKKTYSARMQYGFDKGIEFALEQVNKNDLLPLVVCRSCVFFEQKIEKNKGICLHGSFGEKIKLRELMSDDFGCKYFKDINSLK